ncbi:MAG: hypothetical protein CM1200mP6_02360 [Anaerolineaceae bacterium]|nr:MAG: hypothetical protein CM1200mP6_02360 [Anaerolineaceae bacterium]
MVCDTPSNIAQHIRHVKGDPDKGFSEADVIVEREFTTVPVHQSYLESHAATAVWGMDGTLTIYSLRKVLFWLAGRCQNCSVSYVKNKSNSYEVGGAFGGKNPTYVETPAALLARKTGRPVRVVMSREEVILGLGLGQVLQ